MKYTGGRRLKYMGSVYVTLCKEFNVKTFTNNSTKLLPLLRECRLCYKNQLPTNNSIGIELKCKFASAL